jgi:hypothetical protein
MLLVTGGMCPILSFLEFRVLRYFCTLRYVYPTELKTFGSISVRQGMLSKGVIGRSWANNYTTASRLPLHPSIGPPNTPFPPSYAKHLVYQKEDADLEGLDASAYYDANNPLSHAALSFVHGGLSPTYPDLAPFPTRINEIAERFLRRLQHRVQPPPHPPYHYPGLPHGNDKQL